MTILELYYWAKERGCEDKNITVRERMYDGSIEEQQLDPDYFDEYENSVILYDAT